MPLLLALSMFLLPVEEHAIDLETISLGEAQRLDGKPVVFTLTIGAPAFTLNGTTVVGPGDTEDEIERTVHLPETDADRGDTITVRGVLRVVHHEAAVVNRQFVPAWDEIRVVRASLSD